VLSGTELDALRAIAEAGGTTTIKVVNRKIGFSSDYVRIVLEGLGRADYINVYRSGKCEMTPKGWRELEGRGWRKETKTEPSLSIKCPGCGQLNKTDRVFCSSCWQYLGDVKEAEPVTSGTSASPDNLQEIYAKYERGEITEQEYKQKRAEIIIKKARD